MLEQKSPVQTSPKWCSEMMRASDVQLVQEFYQRQCININIKIMEVGLEMGGVWKAFSFSLPFPLLKVSVSGSDSFRASVLPGLPTVFVCLFCLGFL